MKKNALLICMLLSIGIAVSCDNNGTSEYISSNDDYISEAITSDNSLEDSISDSSIELSVSDDISIKNSNEEYSSDLSEELISSEDVISSDYYSEESIIVSEELSTEELSSEKDESNISLGGVYVDSNSWGVIH